ncbi:MAG: mannose-1-phosphate guanylyltransferase [Candidatus Pacebacteria bacterium]|nr:mannose-1-phosphate guanylyltransferase [Candidatus Paceibacterota bacterium]
MEKILSRKLKKHLYVSILCGGVGTRLWPRSRKKTPKQFIDLFGEKTIFQRTIDRAKKITTPDKIFVVTGSIYVDQVLTQAPDLLLRNIIAEPQGKDTALAMAVGTAFIYQKDPEAIVINLASDHAIPLKETETFVKDLHAAARAAEELKDKIITVGIKPSYPHTGYGYIEAGDYQTKIAGKKIYEVAQFTEKPDRQTAEKFIATKKYFWNANLYTWKAKVFLATIKKIAPKLSQSVDNIRESIGKSAEAKVLRRVYKEAEKISIDYAVSEKAENLALIAADFGWDDIGDWNVVYERAKKDKDGNVVIKWGGNGGYVVVESNNNLIHFNNQLLALVGVKDLIVVDTDDALLICHRQEAQKAKEIVNKIKEEGKLKYL